MTAHAAAALILLALSACGGNGSWIATPTTPPPETVSQLIHTATGADRIGSGQPPIPFASGPPVSHYAGVLQTSSGPRYTSVHPWHGEQGELNFTLAMSLGGAAGRFFDTSASAGTTLNEDTYHGLGADWRAFEITRDYAGAGTWTIDIATDANDAQTLERPWLGYAPFQRLIELQGIPPLPAGQDWVVVFVESVLAVTGRLAGSLDGVPGSFTCLTSGCYLEIDRSTEAPGYHPGGTDVLFTPDDPSLSPTTLASVTGVDRLPPVNYLVFGNWLYAPEHTEAPGAYDLGVMAGGGDPFSSPVSGLAGVTTYAGSASGRVFTGRSSASPSVGSFEADVTLTADFDDGELGGRVENIRSDAAATGLPSELHLEATPIVSLPPSAFLPLPHGVAVAAGAVRDGEPASSWAGEWNAAFYGNGASPTDHPTRVAGTFGASNGEDGLLGSFGAHAQ